MPRSSSSVEVKHLYTQLLKLGIDPGVLRAHRAKLVKLAHKANQIVEQAKAAKQFNTPFDKNEEFFSMFLTQIERDDRIKPSELLHLFIEYQITQYTIFDAFGSISDVPASAEEIKTVFDVLKAYHIDFTDNTRMLSSVVFNAKSLLDLNTIFEFYLAKGHDLKNNIPLVQYILSHYKGPSTVFLESVALLLNYGLEMNHIERLIHVILQYASNKNLPEHIKFLLGFQITTESIYSVVLFYTKEYSASGRDFMSYLRPSFELFRDNGVDFAKNTALCTNVVTSISKAFVSKREPYYLDSLQTLIRVLNLLKHDYTRCPFLLGFLELIPFVPTWEPAIKLMNDMGLSLEKNPDKFERLFRREHQVTRIAQSWHCLHMAGVNGDSKLFMVILLRAEDVKHLETIVSLLQELHITYAEYPEHYTEALLVTHAELVLHFLQGLKQAGYRSDAHKDVYLFFTEQLSNRSRDYIAPADAFKTLCDFASNNKLLEPGADGFDQQKKAITRLFNGLELEMTYSPLNLSTGTEIIRAICEVIVEVGLDEVDMYYDVGSYYFHDRTRNKTLNLSIIIKNANLSQLCLGEELMSGMEQLLKQICTRWGMTFLDDLDIYDDLHSAELGALRNYTSYGFVNLNRLFRDEQQLVKSDDPDAKDISVVTPEYRAKEIAAFFMLGCLMHHAMNRVMYLQDLPDGKDIGTMNQELSLERKEKLTQEIIDQRIVNPRTYPALTSFSKHFGGSAAISDSKDIHTILSNGSSRPCVYLDEGEVIFSQGTQVITRQIKRDYLVELLVSSPSFDRGFNYWSDLALKTAWELHLKHAYKDEPQAAVAQGDVTVNRPNYGLPHAFHVQSLVTHSVEYFARHAADEGLGEFCRSIPDDWVELLRIAAAFSVSGRESEFSYYKDPVGYQKSREESAGHFVAFALNIPCLKENPAAEEDPLVILLILYDVIRGMSNPCWEDELDERQRSGEMSLEHATLRKYLHRILSFAHDVNRVHCCSAREYKRIQAQYLTFVEQSEAQQADLNERIRYVVQLHKAHGIKLRCDLTDEGCLVDVELNYTATFFKVGNSINPLYQASEGVKRPATTLSFQWEGQEKTLKRGAEGKTSATKRQMIEPAEELSLGLI